MDGQGVVRCRLDKDSTPTAQIYHGVVDVLYTHVVVDVVQSKKAISEEVYVVNEGW